MGNSNSDPITDSVETLKDSKEDFEVMGPCRTAFGHAIEWRHKKTRQVYIVKSKILDEDPGEAQARIKFLAKQKSNCIRLAGISKMESSQGWCAAVLYELRIDQMGQSISELVKSGYKAKEKDAWGIIIGIIKVGSFQTGPCRVRSCQD